MLANVGVQLPSPKYALPKIFKKIHLFALVDLDTLPKNDIFTHFLIQVKSNPTTDFNDDSPNKTRLGRKPSFSLLRVVPNIVLASKGMRPQMTTDDETDKSEKSEN